MLSAQCLARGVVKCSVRIYWINEVSVEIVSSVSHGVVVKLGLEHRSLESQVQPGNLPISLFLRCFSVAHRKTSVLEESQ